MLALDATFSGIDPVAWKNLSRLLLPPPAHGTAPAGKTARPPLVLFLEGGRVVQMLRPGPRPSPEEHEAELSRHAALWHGPGSLRALRRAAQAGVLVVFEEDGPRELHCTVEGRVRGGDDPLQQLFGAIEAAREQHGRSFHVDPNPFVIPLPGAEVARRAIDLLLPDDRSLVLYIVDQTGETARPGSPRRPRVFASLVLCKRRGQITHVSTHAGLGLHEPSGDLRRDAKQLSQAAARVGKPHLGLYLTLPAWRRVVGPQPGALAKAVALGEAIIDPVPAWMLAMTGLGAATGLAEGAGRLLGRYLPKSVVSLAKQVGSGPFQALGIDPLDLWDRATRLARGED